MREIKFRAWDKKRKKMWSHWNLYCMDCSNEYPFLALIKGYYATNMFPGEEMDIEIMQYTGLKDKNGKEIYEGDVLRDNDCFLWEVYWEDGAFLVKGGEFDEIGILSDLAPHRCEIVGNIYENPERESGRL